MTDWRRWGRGLLIILTIFLVVVSFLPLWWTDRWWVRLWDFPRLQVAGLLVAVVIALFFARRHRLRWPLISLALAALAWQASHFIAYFPPWPKQVKGVENCSPGRQISLLNANLLLTNAEQGGVIAMARKWRPDVLLLLEAGQRWEQDLQPLVKDYPYRLVETVPNTYGMILLSRLPMEGEIRYLLQPAIPSARALVTLRGGQKVVVHALHPEPPYPGDDSGERDAELVLVGKEVRKEGKAAMVVGDLNDVAWSRTSRLFRDVAGMNDPRVGRGFYPTYNANYPLLRWPLDHLFVSPHFDLVDMRLLPDIGSDHFPILFRLCLRDNAGERKVAPSIPRGAREEARAEINEGVEERGDEAGGQ